MGQQFRYWCPMETRRLLVWLVGMMFVLIMGFQLLELPAGNILSFISSAHSDQMAENGILLKHEALLRSQEVGNVTSFDGLNATKADHTHDRADKYGKEKGSDVKYAFESEASRASNQLSRIDDNDQDSSLHKPNTQSTLNHLNNSDEIPESDANEQRFSRENMSLPIESIRTSDVNDGIVSEGNMSSETGNPHDDSDTDDDEDDDDDDESSLEQLVQPTVDSAVDTAGNSDNRSEREESEQSFSEENTSFSSKNAEISNTGIGSDAPVLPPVNSLPNITLPRNVESSIRSPVAHIDSNSSSVDKNTLSNSDNDKKSGKQQKDTTANLNGNSPTTTDFKEKRMPKLPISGVVSVSDMHSLLLQSWSSPSLPRPRWDSPVDKELLHAKSQIENAPIVKNDPILYAPVYWNVSMFKRSYELMEDMLKIYIYKEGERPILHQPVLKGIYASEGWFMKHLEASKKFVTKKPRQAHLFYLPFSSRNLEIQLYVPDSHSRKNLVAYLRDYLNMIVAKYPFWNRTEGADHFLVACHDWAPAETEKLMSNCIRALCNADAKGAGFVFGKDTSLPETNVRTPQNPLRELGGKPPSQRTTLAFFAGSMHGYLRPILLKHWANKDPDMKIFGKMPKAARRKTNNYVQHMKNSKYCICARGYEVNSPRVVEAIMYECVPVIVSDNYVPPFFEILNWESFAVFISEKDIPNLKNILVSIPEKRYLQMQMRIKKVQQHFLWHSRPVKYDLFHMILHSIWYNRVFQMQHR